MYFQRLIDGLLINQGVSTSLHKHAKNQIETDDCQNHQDIACIYYKIGKGNPIQGFDKIHHGHDER